VRVTTPDGAFEYRVDSIRLVKPNQTEVLAASSTPTLTLITCYPFHYVGKAPDRFIVRAKQVALREADSRSTRR
jgi:sortase A